MHAIDKECIASFISGCILTIILCIIVNNYNKEEYSSPVEEINIDSLSKATDSLKVNINILDSIKQSKIDETLNLNTDSTIDLFYKLVSE